MRPKIVQLLVRGSVLYGLDATGDVWRSDNSVDATAYRGGIPATPEPLVLRWRPVRQEFLDQ